MRVLAVAVFVACAGSGCDRFADPAALVTKAEEAVRNKDLASAVLHLKSALQKDPDNARARLLLGQIYLQQGEAASAVKELGRARDLGMPADEVIPLQAVAMAEAGEFKALIEQFSDRKLDNPQAQARLLALVGDAQLANGKAQPAREAYEKALAIFATEPRAQLGLSRLAAIGGDIASAEKSTDAVLAAVPDMYEGHFLKGELKKAQGDAQGALAEFRRTYELKPEHVRARSNVLNQLIADGKDDEARKEIAALRKVSPKNPLADHLEGVIAFRERRLPEARASLERALSAAPGYVPSMIIYGAVMFDLGSYAQAEQFLEKAVSASNNGYARRVLVASYLRNGRVEKARQALAPLLKSEAADPKVFLLAGEIEMAANNLDAANRYFEKATQIDPKNSLAHTRLGVSRLAQGDTGAALKDLEAGAQLDSQTGRGDLALIMALLRQKKADQALQSIAAFEQKLPKDPLGPNLRGTAQMLKNDLAGARKSFEGALVLQPTFFPAVSNLARLDIAEKKVDVARGRFEAMLKAEPSNADALMALAAFKLAQGGKKDEVVPLYEKAIVGNPRLAGPRVALVDYLLKQREAKRALEVATDAAAALPDDEAVRDMLALAQVAAGEQDQAEATMSKAASMKPDSAPTHLKLAQLQLATGKESSALLSLKKALSAKPDYLDAQMLLVRTHIAAKRYSEAIAVAREVQKQRPREAIGPVLEAGVQMNQQRFDMAIPLYQEAYRREPNAANASFVVAALLRAGKPADADRFLGEWLKVAPKDVGVRLLVADAAMAGQRLPEARRRYEEVLGVAPDHVMALNNLAWLGAREKDPKARGYAERAYKLAPNNPAVLDTYGVILTGAGESKQGLSMLQQAVKLAPTRADIRLNLGRAYAASGDKGQARAELEQVAKQTQNAEAARQAQAVLGTL